MTNVHDWRCETQRAHETLILISRDSPLRAPFPFARFSRVVSSCSASLRAFIRTRLIFVPPILRPPSTDE
jgi:hypothetical protein